MHKKIFISIMLSLIIAMPFVNSLCAMAADSGNDGNTASKAVAAIVFVIVFLAVSIASAILTYKIKRNKYKERQNKEK